MDDRVYARDVNIIGSAFGPGDRARAESGRDGERFLFPSFLNLQAGLAGFLLVVYAKKPRSSAIFSNSAPNPNRRLPNRREARCVIRIPARLSRFQTCEFLSISRNRGGPMRKISRARRSQGLIL